jgi:hypothetical protein
VSHVSYGTTGMPPKFQQLVDAVADKIHNATVYIDHFVVHSKRSERAPADTRRPVLQISWSQIKVTPGKSLVAIWHHTFIIINLTSSDLM